MFIPWWAPFALPFLIGAIVIDKLTGNAVSGALEKEHKREIDKQFGWDENEKGTRAAFRHYHKNSPSKR
jgi:hypothetical protein